MKINHVKHRSIGRISVVIFFWLALAHVSSAQSYYYLKSKDFSDNYSAARTTIMQGVDRQQFVLSKAIRLPFNEWKFFGKTVTHFKISTSGYITFDTTQEVDIPLNSTLPSPNAPRNAIFAFWDSLQIQNQSVVQPVVSYSNIQTYTYFNADSIFVIQWLNCSPAGVPRNNGSLTSFSIRLYKSGKFDIVIRQTSDSIFTATMGYQNETGTNGLSLNGSPFIHYGSDNYLSKDTPCVYLFIEGAQQQLSVKLIKNQTDPVLSINRPNQQVLRFDARNLGSEEITYAAMHYTDETGKASVADYSGMISGNGSVTTILTPFLNLNQPGGYKEYKVWLTNINHQSAVSDTLSISVFVNLGVTGKKRVLLEIGAATWCGFNPDGHLIVRDLLKEWGDSLVVAELHNSSAMEIPKGAAINSTYSMVYPYGMIDRSYNLNDKNVAVSRYRWSNLVANRMLVSSPLNININNKGYDAVSGKLTFNVKVDFVDYILPGKLALHVYIVENAVRGPIDDPKSTKYNQQNYYSKDATCCAQNNPKHELYYEPPLMYGYYHMHVVREILTKTWGDTAIFSSNPLPGETAEQTFEYILPPLVQLTASDFNGQTISTPYQSTLPGDGLNKPYAMRIIAYVSYHDTDKNKREILNAIEEPFTFHSEVSDAEISDQEPFIVYPNPVHNMAEVSFNMAEKGMVNTEVINILGERVITKEEYINRQGPSTFEIDTSPLSNGIYFLRISNGKSTVTSPFVKEGK